MSWDDQTVKFDSTKSRSELHGGPPHSILLRMPLATAAVALLSFRNMEFDLAVPSLNACRNVDDGKIDFDPSSHTPSHKSNNFFEI
jgi:hypothetical protein